MSFFLLFGCFLVAMPLYLRYSGNLQWEIDYTSCNIKQEEREVKSNRLHYYLFLTIGAIMAIVGFIGVVLGLE